jgi:hypothetical protein
MFGIDQYNVAEVDQMCREIKKYKGILINTPVYSKSKKEDHLLRQ